MCLVAATNALLSNALRARRVQAAQQARVQAGRPGAGRNKAVAHCMCSDVRVCTSMCPLNQDKTSAVKVYTGMSSVHASIYFIWEFHTEKYGHILSDTYNRRSRHIPSANRGTIIILLIWHHYDILNKLYPLWHYYDTIIALITFTKARLLWHIMTKSRKTLLHLWHLWHPYYGHYNILNILWHLCVL